MNQTIAFDITHSNPGNLGFSVDADERRAEFRTLFIPPEHAPYDDLLVLIDNTTRTTQLAPLIGWDFTEEAAQAVCKVYQHLAAHALHRNPDTIRPVDPHELYLHLDDEHGIDIQEEPVIEWHPDTQPLTPAEVWAISSWLVPNLANL